MDGLETKEMLESIDSGVKTVQKACDELGVRVEQHEGLSAEVKKITDGMEAIQAANQEQAGIDAERKADLDELKKQFARGNVGAAKDEKSFSEYGEEFSRYLKKGFAPSVELHEQVVEAIVEKAFHGASENDKNAYIKDMVEKAGLAGNNPQGGYTVRPEISSRVLRRTFETSPMRSVASVMTIGSDSLEMLIDDNEITTGGWVGEVDVRNVTNTPAIGKLIIEAHEQYAQPKATQKFLDDSALDVEGWLSGKVSSKFSRDENSAFVSGDGALKPKGLMAYADADVYGDYQRGRIQTLTSTGTAGTLDSSDDLLNLQNGLKEDYQSSAIWGMQRASFGSIITLKDSQGQYLFTSRMINETREMTLLGKRVIFMSDLDAIGTGNMPVIYGDFGEGYTIVDRFGIRVIRDELTEKPYIKFYTTKRTGGDVTSYDSWNRLKIN